MMCIFNCCLLLLIHTVCIYNLNPDIEYYFYHLAYFYRFHNLKFLQFQAADDQYFPPDSEDFFWNDLQVITGGSYLR